MIPGKQYTPELVLAIAWRRKWLILIPAVLISAGVFVYAYRLPDLYQSQTLIQVVPPKVPADIVRQTFTTRIEDRVRSINQEVRTRVRLERVMEEFNLYPERRKTDIMQDIVDDMNRSIGVDVIQGDLFRVSFTSDDPRIARDVTERLGSFFIDESTRDRAVLAEGTNQFLGTELDDAKRRLVETEQRLVEYRRAHSGELPTQVDSNMQGLQNAGMQLQEIRRTIGQDRERQLTLERQIVDLTAAAEAAEASGDLTSDQPSGAAAALAQAREILRQMQVEKTADHPDVAAQRRVVAKLEKEVASQQKSAVTPLGETTPVAVPRARRALDDARRDLRRVQEAIQANEKDERRVAELMREYERRINSAPGRESELTELTRDYSTFQQQYLTLLQKRMDSQISFRMEQRQQGETFRILDPPRVAERPFYPNRPRFYMMGVLVAIGVGLGLAAAAEYLDRGMRSEDDIRLALALPVLATIPDIDASRQLRRGRSVEAAAAAITLAAASVVSWWVLR